MRVFINNKQFALNAQNSIGKGGEADIFNAGSGICLKIFKDENHPDFTGFPDEQKRAKERILEHQQKLPLFPKNLPNSIIKPLELCREFPGGPIKGYSMIFLENAQLLRNYSKRDFREKGVSNEEVIKIFKELSKTITEIHAQNVIIGDFNDLNVLLKENVPYIIDADSFQYGKFVCQLYTERFLDPVLCNSQLNIFSPLKPFNSDSDWYAFNVMLFQSLLFVDPYGGIYKPRNSSKQIPYYLRPLQRITIFNPDVIYPKTAIPYSVLPEELLQHFYMVFEKDKRGEFPLKIIEDIKWVKCPKCSIIHAKINCPVCTKLTPALIKELKTIRGSVIVQRVFKTKGQILNAVVQRGKLRWLYNEDGSFIRENGEAIVSGKLNPLIKTRIIGERTIIGQKGQAAILEKDKKTERFAVDTFNNIPQFDTNSTNIFWINNGRLLKCGVLGEELVGNVLEGQTKFWLGEELGFGFYRAAQINTAFLFETKKHQINDSIKISNFPGQITDCTCVFAQEYCWFFVQVQHNGVLKNFCTLLDSKGNITAISQGIQGDGSWLGTIYGKCAFGSFLFSGTEEGLVRVEPSGGSILKTRQFPDAQEFVDGNCKILPDKSGLYIVNSNEINFMKII